MIAKTGMMCAALLVVAVSGTRADVDRAGTTGANFLTVGANAGILGMGSATLGLGGDLNAVSWNAATLGWMNDTQFALAHAGLPDQTAHDWVAFGGRMGGSATRWALSGLYASEGSFEGRDASNVPTADFSVSSMAFAAHVARPLGAHATVGVGGRFVSDKLGDVTGSGMTFDAGMQLRAGRLGLGLAAQNLGGSMRYDGASYPFPTNVGVGLALDDPSHGLRMAVDANFPSAYYNDVRAGVEWAFRERFALRTGYRRELGAPGTESLSGPSFGMGAGVRGVWLDYSYLVPGSGDGMHRLGLTLHPGQFNLAGDSFHHAKPAPTFEDAVERAKTAGESKKKS